MTPDQDHIARLQRVIAQAARYGTPETRVVLGMAIMGELDGAETIGQFVGPDWPTGVVDSESVRMAAVARVMDRAGWRDVVDGYGPSGPGTVTS